MAKMVKMSESEYKQWSYQPAFTVTEMGVIAAALVWANEFYSKSDSKAADSALKKLKKSFARIKEIA